MIPFIRFNSASVAEIVRAGILALPKGQMEAARATGLNYIQTMTYIILPKFKFQFLGNLLSLLRPLQSGETANHFLIDYHGPVGMR